MSRNPFTLYNQFNVTIIEEELDNCATNFQNLLKTGDLHYQTIDSIDFTQVCNTPDLVYMPIERKFLIYESKAKPGVTVFFCNLLDGWYTAIYNYVRLFKTSAMQIKFTIQTGKYEPAYMFRHLTHKDAQVEERVIQLIKEDKWSFFDQGKVLPFENTANYLKKRKMERLNNAILIEYLQKAGYDISNENFYKGQKGYLATYK